MGGRPLFLPGTLMGGPTMNWVVMAGVCISALADKVLIRPNTHTHTRVTGSGSSELQRKVYITHSLTLTHTETKQQKALVNSAPPPPQRQKCHKLSIITAETHKQEVNAAHTHAGARTHAHRLTCLLASEALLFVLKLTSPTFISQYILK